ncbi:MAG: nucleotidyl transferase AbiEii/AbiGii toxin family protein [Pseudomonadota bacterium]|nr:nucleotidyl transferase AbiEii/AbiGii toxin family protein [Pseudomonadota bacterium]
MTPALLDFSLRPELGLHARVVADIEAVAAPMGITPMVTGAFARDLHLLYRGGIDMQRKTEDIDFGLAMSDWTTFAALRECLIASGNFQASPRVAHQLRHGNGLLVDLVPFGSIETGARKIAWPPAGDVVMDVFGFREALASAHPVMLPGNVQTRVVSLPALALLKIVCWQDRHYRSPRKDAHDIQVILQHYLTASNVERLFEEFTDWTQDDDFQYELAGPRMLGHDMRQLLDPPGCDFMAGLLRAQVDPDKLGVLPSEMNTLDAGRARQWLAALLRGLLP